MLCTHRVKCSNSMLMKRLHSVHLSTEHFLHICCEHAFMHAQKHGNSGGVSFLHVISMAKRRCILILQYYVIYRMEGHVTPWPNRRACRLPVEMLHSTVH